MSSNPNISNFWTAVQPESGLTIYYHYSTNLWSTIPPQLKILEIACILQMCQIWSLLIIQVLPNNQ